MDKPDVVYIEAWLKGAERAVETQNITMLAFYLGMIAGVVRASLEQEEPK